MHCKIILGFYLYNVFTYPSNQINFLRELSKTNKNYLENKELNIAINNPDSNNIPNLSLPKHLKKLEFKNKFARSKRNVQPKNNDQDLLNNFANIQQDTIDSVKNLGDYRLYDDNYSLQIIHLSNFFFPHMFDLTYSDIFNGNNEVKNVIIRLTKMLNLKVDLSNLLKQKLIKEMLIDTLVEKLKSANDFESPEIETLLKTLKNDKNIIINNIEEKRGELQVLINEQAEHESKTKLFK